MAYGHTRILGRPEIGMHTFCFGLNSTNALLMQSFKDDLHRLVR